MLTIDELAKATGLSARSIRAYQTKRLIPTPEMHGRVAYYTERHRDLLLLIKELLEQGLNLNAISLLLQQEAGREHMMSRIRERASHATATPDDIYIPVLDDQIEQLKSKDPSAVEQLERSGLIRKRRDGKYETSAALFSNARELFALGIPNTEIAEIYIHFAAMTRALSKSQNPSAAADVLVNLFELMLKSGINEERR